MHIPPAIKKRQAALNSLLTAPEFEQTKKQNPAVAQFLQEEVARVDREIEMWHLLERMKRVKAERIDRTYHQRGKQLISRTNPKGMRGVLMSTGNGPCIRFYNKDKSEFKDYDFGWLVDVTITIEDGDHELKQFIREDGTPRNVIEIAEFALKDGEKSLEPGETAEL